MDGVNITLEANIAIWVLAY